MAASVLCKLPRFCALAILGVCQFCGVLSARAQAPPAAAAQSCGPQIWLASIDLTPVPADARMLVPVTVNGTPQKLLLGTAGGFITLNQAATDALQLRAHQSDSRLLDDNGYASRNYVLIDDFAVANMHVAKHTFPLTPDPKAGSNPPDDGVFDVGLNYRFDVEMDFARHKLNYFSPNHCKGHVIYWPAQAVGIVPITVSPRTDDRSRHGDIASGAALLSAGLSADYLNSLLALIAAGPGIVGNNIQTTVTLDGQQFTANIDTALEYSTLDSQAARSRFDVTADSPGSAPVGSLADDDANRSMGKQGAIETVTVYGSYAFAHTFHNLTFGGVTVNNPHFMVRPDRTGERDPDNGYLSGTRVHRLDNNVEPDISIGMDVLRNLHLYFAFPERKLYVTPATPDVADAGAGASAAPAGPSAPAH